MPALLLRLLILCPRKQTLNLPRLIFRTTLKTQKVTFFSFNICGIGNYLLTLHSLKRNADMAQLVEQRIRNAWVTSSSLVIGSMSMREGA